ncbi:MAG: glycosyltransferase [Actinomycetota bacterium]
MTDVLFTFSTETLADALHRQMMRPPDQMLQTLAHHAEVERLLVADAPRWIGALIKRRGPRWPDVLGAPRGHVRPLRLRRHEPSAIDGVRRHVAAQERQLRYAARRNGLRRPNLITFDPLLAGFGDFGWAGAVTYYARDDWAAFPPRRPWWEAYDEAYQLIGETGRGVLAVSQPLLDRIAPTGPSAVIVNGIDPTEWHDPDRPPAWFSSLPRPVVTYVGTVDDRIDPAQIASLATMPGTVLLVGPSNPQTLERMDSKVRHHVARDRRELAALVCASDAGLIPHRATSLTHAMSPLKLYEYRAAGLPVASTDLPPIRAEAAVDARIVLAGPAAEDFAAACRTALERGSDDQATRRAYAEAGSWTARHRDALEIILRR